MDIPNIIQVFFLEHIPQSFSRFPYHFDLQSSLIYLAALGLMVLLSVVHECGHFFFGKRYDCEPKLQFLALQSRMQNLISPFSTDLDDQKVAALPNGEYRMVVIGGVLFEVPVCIFIWWVGLTMEQGAASSILVIAGSLKCVLSLLVNLIPDAKYQNDGYRFLHRP